MTPGRLGATVAAGALPAGGPWGVGRAKELSMLRKTVGVCFVLAVAAAVATAEEISGTLKKIDPEAGVLTVASKKGEKEVTVTDTTKFVVYQG
jgi:hypothetical protein